MMILIAISRVSVECQGEAHLKEADHTLKFYISFIIQKYFKMDSLIALKGKDFVIIAADTTNAYSVLRMKVGFISSRTSTTKFGTSTGKNYLPLEESIPMFLSLEITFKKISHSCNIKMDINCQPMTLLNSSDLN